MSTWRIAAVVAAGLVLLYAPGCRLSESGPSDEEVSAAIRKAPPSPPTFGPTYLASVASVRIEERGRYNAAERYWPVRVRVSGNVSLEATSPFQLGLLAKERQAPQAAVFTEDARFSRDDFGNWRVSYDYDVAGPSVL